MEYEFYPEALEHVIRKVHEVFTGDIIVTENGIAVDRATQVRTPKASLKFLGGQERL